MKVELLKLAHFRNYKNLEIAFNSNVNIFYGRNGRGKSNILEAIHILLMGQSFRKASVENLITNNPEIKKSHISMVVNSPKGTNSVDCRLDIENKAAFYINNKKTNSNKIRDTFSAVLFCPESLSVIKSGPEARRALIDEIISTNATEGVKTIRDYSKCHLARSKILRDYSKSLMSGHEAMAVLESLEPLFLSAATRLILARFEAIKSLQNEAQKQVRSNLNNNSVDMSVEYVISSQSAIDWSQNQVYDALKIRIGELRAAELKLGKSLVGPHRHEIRFNFNGQDSRQYCSQGQQRAIILAVKIAQVIQHKGAKGKYPVILLDDVFSEFDLENRQSLLRLLYQIPAQKFITATEVEKTENFGLSEMNATNFLIENDTANAR